MGKTIKSRLVLMEVFILVFIVGIFSLFYFFFADSYYIYKKSELMEKAFEQIHSLKFPDYFENMDLNENFFIKYEEENFKFLIADEEFQALYYTQSDINPNRDKRRAFEWMKERKNSFEPEGKVKTEIRDGRGEVKKLSLSGIIESKGRNYYIYISEMTYIAEKSVTYAKNLTIIAMVFAVLTGSLIFYFAADKITKPIIEIDKVANAVAAKDFTVKVEGNMRYAELERLAESVNSMASQIQEYIQELEKYNRSLVKENEYKTELELMRKQFVNNVSHELKTPLAIISGQVEMLSYVTEENKKEYYYNSIIEEVNEMSEMLNSMLTIFSMEHGMEEMELAPLNLSRVICKLIERYEIMFQQKGIKCERIVEENCFVMANEKYITQAITNFVMNAYKHTQKGRRIKIGVHSNNKNVYVFVYNDGETIPEEEKDKIWNSFYRGTEEKKKGIQYSGTGLGLYIVKNIIKFHYGECGIHNKENGVEFYFILEQLVDK